MDQENPRKTYNLRTDPKRTPKGQQTVNKTRPAQSDETVEDVCGHQTADKRDETHGTIDPSFQNLDRLEDVSRGERELEGFDEELGLTPENEIARKDIGGNSNVTELTDPETKNREDQEGPNMNQQILLFMSEITREIRNTQQEIKDTQKEIRETREATQREIRETREATQQELRDTREATQKEIRDAQQNTEQMIKDVINGVNHRIDDIQIQVAENQAEANQKIQKIEGDLNQTKRDLTNQYKKIEEDFKEEKISNQTKFELVDFQVQKSNRKIESIEGHIKSIDGKIVKSMENMRESYQEAINDRLKDHHQNHESDAENANRILDLENRLDEALGKMDRMEKINITPNIHVTCTGGSPHMEYSLPIFNGRAYNPKDYLQRLKSYYLRSLDRRNTQNTKEIDYLKDLLENSLTNHAARWWQLIKEDVDSWNHFERIFIAKFWSRDVQRAIKGQIELERYRKEGKLSRSEYFIKHVVTLKSMTEALTDEEIITLLGEHFDTLTQDAIRVQDIKEIHQMESLLQKFDLADNRRNIRNANERENNRRQPNHRPNPFNRPERNQFFNENRREINPQAYYPRNNHNNGNFQRNNGSYQNQNRRQDRSPPRGNPNQNSNQNARNYLPDQRNYPSREQAALCRMIAMERRPPPTSNNHPPGEGEEIQHFSPNTSSAQNSVPTLNN